MNLRTTAAHWGASFYLIAAWSILTSEHPGRIAWQLLTGTALACYALSRPTAERNHAQ